MRVNEDFLFLLSIVHTLSTDPDILNTLETRGDQVIEGQCYNYLSASWNMLLSDPIEIDFALTLQNGIQQVGWEVLSCMFVHTKSFVLARFYMLKCILFSVVLA